ncbi:hypothetical protein FACS1894181_12470 [Bacteroidia bacterium]|nr:hypothetical protein FACS1894181_12470 [Bacteroidia bacterium]
MKIKTITLLLLLLVITSCKQTGKTITYQLVKAEKELSFFLDDNTKSSMPAFFFYTGKEGKEYLTFKNDGEGNDIVFYDMQTKEQAFKVHTEIEGNNGVGRMASYYIHNLDSIFVMAVGVQIITLIDRSATVKDKFTYYQTNDGIPLLMFGMVSLSQPMVILDGKMFIAPVHNRQQQTDPLCATINLADKLVYGLDVQFPKFPPYSAPTRAAGHELVFSRCFDGRQFAYSFCCDEDIHIADINHTAMRKAKAKSKYIDRIGFLNDNGATMEEICTNPEYGNLVYDKYRDVYYRVAYPQTEIEKGVNARELIQYGRKNFSILILDKDFNVVGETKFPDYTYNSMVWFVREDGLYISASHFMNPSYSDDWLVFHRFDLVEKKK